jgi:hypothetical protein
MHVLSMLALEHDTARRALHGVIVAALHGVAAPRQAVMLQLQFIEKLRWRFVLLCLLQEL